jgi:hypothetical protein
VHPYPEEKKSRTALRVPPGFQLHQINHGKDMMMIRVIMEVKKCPYYIIRIVYSKMYLFKLGAMHDLMTPMSSVANLLHASSEKSRN